MARQENPSKQVIAAALTLAASKPWREISLTDIAEAAKIKPATLAKYFPSKRAILDGFSCQIDDQVAQGFSRAAADETVRDQLFDILMARFDALLPHKAALKSILRQTIPFDPLTSTAGIKAVVNSMAKTLALVGIQSPPPLNCLKAKTLAALYLYSFKTWLEDDSADMAKTMASLDGGLARAENLVRMMPMLKSAPVPKDGKPL